MNVRIIGWTAWHDPRFPDEHNDPLFGERRAEVVEELKRRDYHFTGYYHQEGECGVPIFDDGGALRVSFRSWGQIMADAWPEEKCPERNAYIRWAWYPPPEWEGMVIPRKEDYPGFEPWYEPLTEEQFREQYH
jgi:hypothetical protein